MKSLMSTFPRRLMRHRYRNLNDPWQALSEIENEMERWFGDTSSFPEEYGTFDFTPICDLKENKKEYIAKFDLPGVKKGDLKIEVENNRLTVRGERKEEKKEEDEKHYLSESYQGSFVRTFALPSRVNEDKVDAKFEDGVLTVKIPKVEPSKAKAINIQ